jgi:hypothetical protein
MALEQGPKMWKTGLLIAVAMASLITGLVAVRAISITESELADPCWEWGPSSMAHPHYSSAGGPCQHVGANGETKTRAVVRTIIVPGGILVGLALGAVGVMRSKPAFAFSGAALMFVESPLLLWSFWPVTVFLGIAFLLDGVRSRREPRAPDPIGLNLSRTRKSPATS